MESLHSEKQAKTQAEKLEEHGQKDSLRGWLERLRRTLPGSESFTDKSQTEQSQADTSQTDTLQTDTPPTDQQAAQTLDSVSPLSDISLPDLPGRDGAIADAVKSTGTTGVTDDTVNRQGGSLAASALPGEEAPAIQDGDAQSDDSEAAQNERAAEALLVMQAKQDPEAFGILYERYVDRIYSYIYHRVGSAQDAEDLTARTFYRALDKLESYEDRGLPFSAWLFRIAHNLMANWHRDRSRRRFLSLDRLWFYGNNRQSPETLVEEDEKHEALWSAIERLPEDRKNLLVLKFGSQLSNLEIGNLMEKSESAIKSLYFRTLASLREDLEKRGWGIDMMRRPEILDEPVAEPNRDANLMNSNRAPTQQTADDTSPTSDSPSLSGSLSDPNTVPDPDLVPNRGGDK